MVFTPLQHRGEGNGSTGALKGPIDRAGGADSAASTTSVPAPSLRHGTERPCEGCVPSRKDAVPPTVLQAKDAVHVCPTLLQPKDAVPPTVLQAVVEHWATLTVLCSALPRSCRQVRAVQQLARSATRSHVQSHLSAALMGLVAAHAAGKSRQEITLTRRERKVRDLCMQPPERMHCA